MRRIVLSALLLALLVIANSCDEGPEETPYQLNMSNFFSDYLNVICDSAANCKSGFVTNQTRPNCPDIILHYPFPFPAFKRGHDIVFMQKFQMLDASEKAGWVKVDMDQAEVCFDLLREMKPCNPFEVHLADIVECATVFEGTKTIRQECGQDEECDYGWCDTRGRCPGTCVSYKEPGQACNSSMDRCSPGYTCRTSGCSKSTVGEAGDPCITDIDCSGFLYCRRRNESDATGNCFQRKNDGEPCQDVNECMTGLACIENICSKARISDTPGAQCGKVEDEDGEEAIYSCNVFAKLECGPGDTCQTFPQQGQPCKEICDRSLFCDKTSGLCQYQAMIGRPCDDDKQCTTFYCINGVCGVPECIDAQ